MLAAGCLLLVVDCLLLVAACSLLPLLAAQGSDAFCVGKAVFFAGHYLEACLLRLSCTLHLVFFASLVFDLSL